LKKLNPVLGPGRVTAPAIVFTAGLIAILVGCSGGGGSQNTGNPASVLALSRGVRVAIRFSQPAPAGYLARITPDVRQKREAEGVVFESNKVTYPAMPAVGYYLKVGDKFISGGPNGEYFIPKDLTVPADVPFYKQRTDANPIGTVQIASSLQPGSSTLKTVYFTALGRALGGPSLMDGITRSQVTKKAATCCKATTRAIDDGCNRYDCDVASNELETGCCLDYDTTKGRIREGVDNEEENDGEQGTGDCAQQRVAEFYDTECYRWAMGTGAYSAECWNEQAFWQVIGASSCWANHKYRFCQNMSMTDFTVDAGTTTVLVGSSKQIDIRNNTPKYDTEVSQSGDAEGTLQAGDGVELGFFSGATIKHYDDGTKKYIANRTLTYQAPAELPDGKTEAYDTLTFTAAGNTKTITLRIVQKCRDNRGREVPCIN
jgi:hypothetical protein